MASGLNWAFAIRVGPQRITDGHEDVQATSHEEAVAQIAALRPLTEAGAVYEVWLAQEPGCILRVTLEPPRPRPPIP
jgi:hypothetical protein